MKYLQLTLAALVAVALPCSAEQTVSTIEFATNLSLDGIVVSDDAVMYGAQGFNGFRIHRVNLDGTSQQVATSLNGPIDMDFDSAGVLYVTTFNDRGLFSVDVASGTFERVATVNNGPSGIAIDRDRNVAYVSHYGTGQLGNGNVIYAVDLETRERTTLASGNGLLGVVSLAVDDTGNLYAANIANAKIFRITPGGELTQIATLPTNPNQNFNVGHIAWARGGLYVTGNGGFHVVYRVEPSGEFEVIAGSGQAGSEDGESLAATFNAPNGIAASVTGDSLFVSELNNPRAIRVVELPPVETGSRVESVPSHGFELEQSFPNPAGPPGGE